jgi:hypothetical protein
MWEENIQEQGERIQRDDNAHVCNSCEPDLDVGDSSNDLPPFELFFFKVHGNSLLSDVLDFGFFGFFLSIVCRDSLCRFRQGRVGGNRGRLTESPDWGRKIERGRNSMSGRVCGSREEKNPPANCRSSSVRNLAEPRSVGIIAQAMNPITTVAIPSRMKIQRQPDRPATPSILMIALARRPANCS